MGQSGCSCNPIYLLTRGFLIGTCAMHRAVLLGLCPLLSWPCHGAEPENLDLLQLPSATSPSNVAGRKHAPDVVEDYVQAGNEHKDDCRGE